MRGFYVVIFILILLNASVAVGDANETKLSKAPYKSGKKIFKVSMYPTNYERAVEDCAIIGAIPATIESEEDLEQIDDLIGYRGAEKFWVGLEVRRTRQCMGHAPFNSSCWGWTGKGGISTVLGMEWSEDVKNKFQNIRSKGVILNSFLYLDFEDKYMMNPILCESLYDDVY